MFDEKDVLNNVCGTGHVIETLFRTFFPKDIVSYGKKVLNVGIES